MALLTVKKQQKPRRRRFWQRDDAVTPVVGSLLILGITAAGLVAAMAWGAPLIQRTQEQSHLESQARQLETVRDTALRLTVPDAARTPGLALPSGSLGLTSGTRMVVVVSADDGYPDCDPVPHDWSDDDNAISWTSWDGGGCRAPSVGGGCTACLEVDQVVGDQRTSHDVAWSSGTLTVTSGGQPSDLGSGTWRIQMTFGGEPVVQVWIFDLGRVAWDGGTGQDLAAMLEGGAVFTRQDDNVFLRADPVIRDNVTGEDDLLMRLPVLEGDHSTVAGGTAHLFLGLLGNHERYAGDVYTTRWSFSGDLAESWCTSLLLRDDATGDDHYVGDCDDDEPTVQYRRLATPSSDPSNASFHLEFLHARLRTILDP
ncbi:MAG: hypothetical protein ACPGQL_08585 [Thermoplasmatota archaeon]